MSNVYEIPAQDYNDKLAAKLKDMPEFKMPDWALFVKTGSCREKPPINNDWWYNRAASILRQAYLRGLVGVNRLKVRYGGNKNRGMKPSRFARASGKIIRVMLQQSEKAGLLQKVTEGKRKGRTLTKQGKQFMEAIK